MEDIEDDTMEVSFDENCNYMDLESNSEHNYDGYCSESTLSDIKLMISILMTLMLMILMLTILIWMSIWKYTYIRCIKR